MKSPPDEAGRATTVSELLDGDSPRWEAIDFEVKCARCGYNLRMLPAPRCPECGLEFAWTPVLSAHAWRSEFLFEHHWRRRFFQSWLITVWRSLWPRSFWRQVSIHEHVMPGPLWVMIGGSILIFLIALHGTALLGAELIDLVSALAGNPPIRRGLPEFLTGIASMPIQAGLHYLLLPAAVAIIELAVLGFLNMLQETLSRARVRPVQILRVFAYSSTPFLLTLVCAFYGYCIIGATLEALTASNNRDTPSFSLLYMFLVGLLIIMFFSLPGLYVGVGLREYLKLPRSLLIGFTATFVALLFLGAVFSILGPLIG